MDIVGYYFFHIFPASLFTSWLKRPIMLKGPLKLVYRFLKWRYLSIAKFRKSQQIKSKTLKNDITYSQVSIPSMPMLLTKFPEMLSVWVENYLRLEIDAFIEKLEAKLQPKTKQDLK
jgi:hypothetical protein